MADQMSLLIQALRRLKTAIMQTESYRTPQTYSLDPGAIVLTTGASAALGVLSVFTELISSAGGAGVTDGVLSVLTELIGSAVSSGGGDGVFNIAKQLAGVSAGVSGISGDISTYFVRNQRIDAASEVTGALTVPE